MNNKNEEFVKKENENNELKNIIKQLENKNNILQGEITALISKILLRCKNKINIFT